MRYKYTNEDIEFLKENYPIGNWVEIHNRFPEITDSAISHKCSRLGIKFDNVYRQIKRVSNKIAWTEEELAILKNNYSCIDMCKMLDLLPNRTRNSIQLKAAELGLISYSNSVRYWTQDEIDYIKENWELTPDILIAQDINRPVRSVQWKRLELGLLRRDMESNSYPTLAKYLRGQNQKWKNDSMKSCDYKCVITGSKDFEIHHLYGVSNIISDLLDKYKDYKDKPFEDYTNEDLSFILTKFLEEQSKYPLGECIDKKLHILFHSSYGQYYNTPEQWEQFKKDYNNGRYKNIAK